jgi:cold shock CspA family protein
MKIPVHITAKGPALAADQEAMIQGSVAGLERYYARLVGCRVVVGAPHRRPGGEPVEWTFRLFLTVPGGELAVTRQARPSFREALEDAFDAARRQLQDYAREMRGDVKLRAEELQGRVSKLLSYEGYGFISTQNGDEIYFHRNSVPNAGFDRLEIGTDVRYVAEEGERGTQASTVVAMGRAVHAGPPAEGATVPILKGVTP